MTKRAAPADTAPDRMTDELDAVLGELPAGGAAVVLTRQNDRTPTQWDYMGRIPAAEFSVEAVKTEHGGGNYRARVINDRNKYVRGGSYVFSIDARFRPQAAAPVATSAPVSELTEIKELLKTTLLALATRNTAPTADPFDLALRMVALTKDAHPPAALATADVLATFREGLKLGRDVSAATAGGGGEGPSDFASAMGAAAPLLGAIAESVKTEVEMKRRRLLASPASRPAAPAAPAAPGPSLPPADATVRPLWMQRVRPYVPQLVALARGRKDAALYADLTLDQIDEVTYAEIRDAAQAPEFVDAAMAAFPELAAADVATWAREFLGHIRAALTGPDDDAGDGATEAPTAPTAQAVGL